MEWMVKEKAKCMEQKGARTEAIRNLQDVRL
jgi:hypothetical protein